MPDKKAGTADDVTRILGQKIHTGWRIAAAGLGLAGLGAGAAAVYITHVEAGPVALITAGLILFLVAVPGRMPRTLRYGDIEANFEEAVRPVIAAAVDNVTPEQTPELVRVLENLARFAPSAAAAGLSTVTDRGSYESEVGRLLEDAARELQASLQSPYPGQHGGDFRIGYGDRLLLVYVRYYTNPPSTSTLWEISNLVRGEATSLGDQLHVEVLLVAPEPLTSAAQPFAKSVFGYPFHAVVVRDTADAAGAAQLKQAVREALGVTQ